MTTSRCCPTWSIRECRHTIPIGPMARAFEKQKTLYDYGVSRASLRDGDQFQSAIAYLMRDNSLLLQILTIATFTATTIFLKTIFLLNHARGIHRGDVQGARGPRTSITWKIPASVWRKSKRILDAAHAVSLQCRRNLAIRKETPAEEAGGGYRGHRRRRRTRFTGSIAAKTTSLPTCTRCRSTPRRICCFSSAITISI